MNDLYFSDSEIESVCEELGIPRTAFNEKGSQRRIIIDCWDNANVIACPGSGKTTVLLAKLLLLSRRMPFEDGSGICVLTHTNVAIDEIKSKLGSKADILFNYPNFFGTIQSFVGRFLLKKVLWELYKTPITVVDTEIFNKKLISSFRGMNQYKSKLHKFLFNLAYKDTLTIKDIKNDCFIHEVEVKGGETKHKKAKNLHGELIASGFLKNNGELQYFKCKGFQENELPSLYGKEPLLKTAIEAKHNALIQNLNHRKEEIILKLWINLIEEKLYNYEDGRCIAGNTSPSYIELRKLKEDLYKSGIVSFRDAFELARKYVKSNHSIANIMSTRFKYLFADEMQDTQHHQMEIVSAVFNTSVIKQYLGDPDQSIFNGISGGDMAWDYNQPNTLKLEISDSKRYSQAISQCINPFKTELSDIVGAATWNSYKPCLLLYDNPEDALEMFHEKIEKKGLTKEDSYINWNRDSSPFNAVGLVGKESEITNEKLTIHSYVDVFSKETTNKKINFNNLVSYFQKRPKEETQHEGTRVYYSLFINAFIELLKLSDIHETKTSLFKDLSIEDQLFMGEFQKLIFLWIKDIEADKKTAIGIKNEFVGFFKENGLDFSGFTFVKDNAVLPKNEFKSNSNLFSKDGVDIKIGTIHSVKGETHMATLLFENKNYSNSEADYFFGKKSGNLFCGDVYKRQNSFKQIEGRLKTAYVAMSRPTHLLCVAMSKERVGCIKCPKEIKENCNWDIITN
jgi:hypothetical protein